jgi:hypothetical protein
MSKNSSIGKPMIILAGALAAAAVMSVHLQRSAYAVESQADFTITNTVVAANPPNVGFNVSSSAGGADIMDNAWISDGGFSPFDIRKDYTATQDGAADGTTFICTGSPGLDFYASVSSGLFDGAKVHVYRFDKASHACTLLRTGTVAKFVADSSKPNDAALHTVSFTTPGPQILAGDAIWLCKDDEYKSPNINTVINDLDPRFSFFSSSWMAAGEGSYKRNDPNNCKCVLDPDSPSELNNGGATAAPLSMKMSDSVSETAGISQYLQGTSVGPNEPSFESGHTYELSVWLKQTGVADGSATVGIGGLKVSHTFTGVTNKWQKFTYKFPAPQSLPANYPVPNVFLHYNAPGTLWAAQYELFDAARPPFTLDPRIMQIWQSFKPGTIRFWSNQSNSGGNYSYWSLDSWLTDESQGRADMNIGNCYEKTTDTQHLPTALKYAKMVGADPWLIVNPSISEEEWSELIEYLAAPPGAGYASRRPKDHPGPYTNDFNTIYLEYGNEEWGTQSTATSSPKEHYGASGHLLIGNAIAGKKYFDKNKIKFIGNGFTLIPDITTSFMKDFKEASLVDYFSYNGGDKTLKGDAYYQNELLTVPEGTCASDGKGGSGGVGQLLEQDARAQKADAAAGLKYQLAVYEGGPGSDAPGSTTSGDDSLAAGIAAVDQALDCSLNGFGPQNFFLFALGTGPYSSHTDLAHGLIPHPVWEALEMRNKLCSGDMVNVVTSRVPKTSDGKNAALIGTYAFHHSSEYDVAVVSRDLNNKVSVTLNFPMDVSPTASLDVLTGDPRADNNSSLAIPVNHYTLTHFSQHFTFSMPPGSFYVFQVKSLVPH